MTKLQKRLRGYRRFRRLKNMGLHVTIRTLPIFVLTYLLIFQLLQLPGTHAYFTSQAESLSITISSGYWDDDLQVESAWAEGTPFGNNWGMYFTYLPGQSPSATLLAGQHKYAGTVAVSQDGLTICITISVLPGTGIYEAHLYAGTRPPEKSAPGKLGRSSGALDGVTEYRFEVPLPDPDAPVFLAVHAVVGGNFTSVQQALANEAAMFFEVETGYEDSVTSLECSVDVSETNKACGEGINNGTTHSVDGSEAYGEMTPVDVESTVTKIAEEEE